LGISKERRRDSEKSEENRRTEEDEDSIEEEFRVLFIHDTSRFGVRPF
jgi:hypothetical protein